MFPLHAVLRLAAVDDAHCGSLHLGSSGSRLQYVGPRLPAINLELGADGQRTQLDASFARCTCTFVVFVMRLGCTPFVMPSAPGQACGLLIRGKRLRNGSLPRGPL
jgi:hypothetical protein